jgi:hypothetical protein
MAMMMKMMMARSGRAKKLLGIELQRRSTVRASKTVQEHEKNKRNNLRG